MGDGTFVEAATPYGIDSLRDGRGLAVSDFDGDGGLDFIINNYNAPAQYFLNRVPNRGHWLRIRLRGRESNREGIGAIIRVRTGSKWQMRVVSAGEGYASQYSRIAHFGLGKAKVIDELQVIWPNGKRTRQTFRSVAVDRLIEIDEGKQEVKLIRTARKKAG
jgi:hypothetical protein